MEFGMEKYATLILNNGKRETIELLNGGSIRMLAENESNKSLRIFETGAVKNDERKKLAKELWLSVCSFV